ncbi:MAG: U32 family peptidase [Ruminococcus sp.]|nr:U32 family peptidase [Ruminococcus sp.]
MSRPKILAPAGSPETLQAVLDCGADEVYIGGKCFSARQNATNFSLDEIRQSVERCHLYGVKLYVAVNTLLLDSQLDEFIEYIKALTDAKVDALIVQDLGALDIIKKVSPNMELHASTQMSIHTVEGAILMRNLGFKRVVLSRELNRNAILEISNLDIDTEIFVHGALCMSVSGQCYLSAMIGSRSANRGLCGQPCRLPFSACGNKDSCALSLKDMSLMEHVQDFIDMGITSLKIEGRMKRPEYSACAVSTLRTALDGHLPDMSTLRSVFCRGGFTDGYYTASKGNMFGVRSKEDVVSAEDVLPKIRETYRKTRKVSKLNFTLSLEHDKPATLFATDEMCSYSVYGDIPVKAINKPLDYSTAERQLSKLGGTIYEFNGLNFQPDDTLTLSASSLNDLRRQLISTIDKDRIHRNEPFLRIDSNFRLNFPNSVSSSHRPNIRLRVRNFEQLEGISLQNVQYIIVPMDSVLMQKGIPSNIVERLIVQPPRFIYNELNTIEELAKLSTMGVKHIMCNNLAYINIGNRLGYILHGDFGLNVLNSLTIDVLKSLNCVDAIVSFELKLSQIDSLKNSIPIGVEAFGRLPLMLVSNCPIKNEVGCKKCQHYISDRTNRKFPVYCTNGYSEIFNAEVMSIADKVDSISNADYYILSFLDETPKEISSILESFENRSKMGTTKGLYIRGII